MVLEMELGMSESEANSTGWRGTDEGTQLKSTSGWSGGGNGTDNFGFSALPGGSAAHDGAFSMPGTAATGGVLRPMAAMPGSRDLYGSASRHLPVLSD